MSGTVDLSTFLKRYSTIPNDFIDELFSLYGTSTTQTDHVVDLDRVAKWLGMRKHTLQTTLNESYRKNIDFKVTRPDVRRTGRGGRNRTITLLTPDAFKRLCMRSRSAKAEQVRTYFISLESLVLKYKDQMMAGMREEIDRLEGRRKASKLKPQTERAGYIYVLRASEKLDSVYKIGRAKDLGRRLREHHASRAEDMEIMFVFRTDDVNNVEACLKTWLRDRQYRKYKEVYQADLDMIKNIISQCDAIGQLKAVYTPRPRTAMHGGHYIAVIAD
jgi:phage anti-repressor protein/predicted GIY-YIG superfamily endonuclease